MKNYTDEVVKCLEEVKYLTGRRSHQIFKDFLETLDTLLDQLPAHLQARQKMGAWAPVPEVRTRLNRVRANYRPDDYRKVIVLFSEAIACIIQSPLKGSLWRGGDERWGDYGPDALGGSHMVFANSEPGWRGQYFTSWDTAQMHAALIFQEKKGHDLVMERIWEALEHPDNQVGQILVMTGLVLPPTSPQTAKIFREMLLPALAGFYKPITIYDPTVGSGVLLLAAAARFPEWAVKLNLIQLYGQDLDRQCWLMARNNCRLWGLNGVSTLNALLEMLRYTRAGLLEKAAATTSPAKGLGKLLLLDEPPLGTYETLYREPPDSEQDLTGLDGDLATPANRHPLEAAAKTLDQFIKEMSVNE